jgi:hypothetical protein
LLYGTRYDFLIKRTADWLFIMKRVFDIEHLKKNKGGQDV